MPDLTIQGSGHVNHLYCSCYEVLHNVGSCSLQAVHHQLLGFSLHEGFFSTDISDVSSCQKLFGQDRPVREVSQGQESLLLRVHHNLVQEFIENILSNNLRLPIEEGNLPGLRDL